MTDTQHVSRLRRTGTALGKALKTVETGTKAIPRPRKRIDIALDHADAWAGWQPPRDGERGGSSSPIEWAERVEWARVARQSAEDAVRARQIIKVMEKLSAELAVLVDRNVETIDPKKIPKGDSGLPGCTNCALAGYFAPVYEKAPGAQLCRWCYDHKRADALERDPEGGTPGLAPPREAVVLFHERGPSVAGRWLADEARDRARRQGALCAPKED